MKAVIGSQTKTAAETPVGVLGGSGFAERSAQIEDTHCAVVTAITDNTLVNFIRSFLFVSYFTAVFTVQNHYSFVSLVLEGMENVFSDCFIIVSITPETCRTVAEVN